MFDAVLAMLDAEFNGKSWNGLSFMATLEKLSWEEAQNINTWEGYSAWEIMLHCAKCKYIIAKDLDQNVSSWNYTDESWFPAPHAVNKEGWEQDKKLLIAMHTACMNGLRSLGESRLEEPMSTWKKPWKTVISWLLTHDAFHGAQMRSMGLPSLKEKHH